MKLAVCIVHNRDKNRITDELLKANFKFTVIGSTGGFLREGNTTFLIGTDDARVEDLKTVIQENCQAREQLLNMSPFEAGAAGALLPSTVKVPVGGAVVFFLNVDEFTRF